MKNNDELSKRFEDIRNILDIRNLNEYQNKCIENSVGTEKQIEVKRKKINKKSLKKFKLSDFICCSILALSLVSGTILLVKTDSDIKKDYENKIDAVEQVTEKQYPELKNGSTEKITLEAYKILNSKDENDLEIRIYESYLELQKNIEDVNKAVFVAHQISNEENIYGSENYIKVKYPTFVSYLIANGFYENTNDGIKLYIEAYEKRMELIMNEKDEDRNYQLKHSVWR